MTVCNDTRRQPIQKCSKFEVGLFFQRDLKIIIILGLFFFQGDLKIIIFLMYQNIEKFHGSRYFKWKYPHILLIFCLF